jgi:hypothetical protein
VLRGANALAVADTNNNVLRLIPLSGSNVSTLVGSGANTNVDGVGTSATFNQPRGLAANSTESGGATLFVSTSSALRRVDARSLQSGMVGTDLAGVHPGP